MENTLDKQNNQYQSWEKQGLFKADPKSAKPSYALLIPPPNLNGELHLGHAMQHAILDCLARFKRLQGLDVLLLPGVDHAGIQFEGTFNKKLQKDGIRKEELGREEWLRQARQFRDEVYESFHNTWTVMGLSADWEKEVYTLEPKVQKAVFEEFKTFWEQDLLYKDAYIVQWCPNCGTAIEDVEMEYEEKKEKLYYIKYRIENANEVITLATARPETIYADTGIAIYRKHPKFSKFIGQMALNPLNGNKLPIFEDKRVDKNFGSGALKITPGHDPLDFEIGKDHNLPILHVIDKTGIMTHLAEELEGLTIADARQKTAQKLEELGAIEKIEDYTHSVPICERCKTTIEPLISEEWFVKMAPLRDKALKHISKINFAPKSYLKLLSSWIKNIHDWCISRSLWWGIRIPVWYCSKCNPNHQVGKDKDMVVSQEEPNKNCQTCGEKHWEQDPQIFDTWFSSGLWPLATLGWPDQTLELKRYYPWDFEITAPEIKYLWIARMIILGLWFKNQIPFKNMFFHGMLRDLQGRKFSKSSGNGIDPPDLIKNWGTDATRMMLYSYSAPGRDGRLNKQIADERCKNFRNFATKIKNITKFIIDLTPSVRGDSEERSHESTADSLLAVEDAREIPRRQDPEHPDDIWILTELEKTAKSITKNLDSFNLHLATDVLYDFIWHKLADVYIEKTKARRVEAQPTLEHVLEQSLILLHPFMPFLTEELWLQKLCKKESIMRASWPAIDH